MIFYDTVYFLPLFNLFNDTLHMYVRLSVAELWCSKLKAKMHISHIKLADQIRVMRWSCLWSLSQSCVPNFIQI